MFQDALFNSLLDDPYLSLQLAGKPSQQVTERAHTWRRCDVTRTDHFKRHRFSLSPPSGQSPDKPQKPVQRFSDPEPHRINPVGPTFQNLVEFERFLKLKLFFLILQRMNIKKNQ